MQPINNNRKSKSMEKLLLKGKSALLREDTQLLKESHGSKVLLEKIIPCSGLLLETDNQIILTELMSDRLFIYLTL